LDEDPSVEKLMHKISKYSTQLGQQHAAIALQHAFSVESCGKPLQKHDQSIAAQENVEFIQDYASTIKYYAHELQGYLQVMEQQDNYSTELYTQAVLAHVCATEAHIEAVSIYSSIIREKLNVLKKQLVKYSHINCKRYDAGSSQSW